MATRYFCDRCDKQINGTDRLCNVYLPKWDPVDSPRLTPDVLTLWSTHNQFGVCDECLRAIDDFVRTLPTPDPCR